MNVREFLNEIFNIDNSDGVMFYPINNTHMDIRGFYYNNDSKYIIGSNGKQYYHIVLYKQDDNKNIIENDNFNAILLDPSVYVSNLIKSGWFGFVSKITETSQKNVNDTCDLLFNKKMQHTSEIIVDTQ